MTLFYAFMDETGTNDPDGLMRVAGLIAPHSLWLRFDKDWQAVLNSSPKIQYWHTNSAFNGQLRTNDPDNRILTAQEAAAKEMALAQVVAAHSNCLLGLHVEMEMTDWRAHVEGKVRPAEKFKKLFGERTAAFLENPVGLVMRETIRLAVHISRRWNNAIRPGEPFHVWSIFERDKGSFEREYQMGVYAYLLKSHAEDSLREAIGPCIFLPSKGRIGWTTIQAADLYASHVQKGRVKGSMQRPAIVPLGSVHPEGYRLADTDLQQMVSDIANGVRPEIPSGS